MKMAKSNNPCTFESYGRARTGWLLRLLLVMVTGDNGSGSCLDYAKKN